MEIGNIGKVANRKRMNVEVEKLREKVSKETTKIIKLKVAQDTAYWDLKEKLQQVEGNHERLQQNMVEVQMQHESISGQYQDELRLRPDILNKLTSNREICEVLEDYSGRLKETLSRCKSDQAVLCEAYKKSGQFVRELKAKQVQDDEKNRQVINGLEEKVKLTTEHQKQLLHVLTSSKQQADSDIADLRQKLETTQKQKDNLVDSVNDLNRKMDFCNFNIEKKDETIANLQRDMKQLILEFNAQSSEAKNTFLKQENDLKEALEANSSLKRSFNNQEKFTQSISDQNNNLQEKIITLEEDQLNYRNEMERLRAKFEEATVANENQKKDIATLIHEKELLINNFKDKEQAIITHYKEETAKLNEELQQINKEKGEIKSDLDKNVEESKMKSVRIEELTTSVEDLLKNIKDIENTHKTFKETSDEKIKELSNIIETKNKELDCNVSSILQLMSEMKTSTDIRAKLETTLQKVKKEIDIERNGVKEKERKLNARIEQLEVVVRDKENELSKQMSLILETRNEKERLQNKIQDMQNMIDNIQKELTGPSAPAPRIQPEQDDNAVILTPGAKKNNPPKSPIIQNSQFTAPRKEPLDYEIFNLFSDSSMEGNTLDPSEVNRRFAAIARGERLPPLTLKRRGATLAPRAHKIRPPARQDCHAISHSQVKNDMKKNERIFFKNKRGDNKNKKIK